MQAKKAKGKDSLLSSSRRDRRATRSSSDCTNAFPAATRPHTAGYTIGAHHTYETRRSTHPQGAKRDTYMIKPRGSRRRRRPRGWSSRGRSRCRGSHQRTRSSFSMRRGRCRLLRSWRDMILLGTVTTNSHTSVKRNKNEEGA